MSSGRITLGGIEFDYRLVRSARRTVSLELTGSQSLVVRVPHRWNGSVPALIESKQAWIMQHAVRFLRMGLERPSLVPGGWGYVLGERCKILVGEVEDKSGGRAIALADLGTAGDLPRHVKAWYQHQSSPYLRDRLQEWSRRLGIAYSRMRLSDATRRWGYCRADGVIGLNWRLYQCPPWVVDYVVVHELLHRRYPHHQKEFWDAVQKAYPDAEKARRWLAEWGLVLMW